MRLITTAWACAAGALLLIQAACGSGVAPDSGTLARVEIAPSAVEVEELAPVALEARLFDAAGNEIDGVTIHWAVADPAIAQVTRDGVVTGRTAGESTQVSASAQGVDALADVKVLPRPVARVLITPDDVDLKHGEATSLTVVVLDRHDREIEDRPVTWSSSNSDIATVNSEGRVTAVRAGSVKIRATADGKTAEAAVDVLPPPVDRVEISPQSATLTVGGSRRFEATARASDGARLDGRTVTWSSADEAIVTIGSDGTARAISPGTTKVEARIEGKSASATVKVEQRAVDRVEISPKSATLKLGQSQAFEAVALDSDGAPLEGRSVSWSSSDPSVVSVDSRGIAQAVKEGKATIEARIDGKKASASISVSPPPVDRVEISPKSATLRIGRTQDFTATARAADGRELKGHSVSWISSNPLVASVDRNGRVRAILWGETTITATIDGKRATADVRVRSLFGRGNDRDDDDDDDDDDD